MIQYVYLVYDECHGFRGVYATEERAKKEVESISKNEYKLNEEEIFPEYYVNGNELCYYEKEVVIYE